MNFPEIHPTLTLAQNGSTIDSVFQKIPACIRTDCYSVDVYRDGEYRHKASMKELTIEEARKWWNTLLKKGYTRKTKGQWTELQNK